jgi:hypothetical protein
MTLRDRLKTHARKKAELTIDAYQLMTRPWFGKTLQPAPDRMMCVLLMHIYMRGEGKKQSVDKIDAWKSMGFSQPRTGRKYIVRAKQFGWLEIKKYPDRRREYLVATPLLKRAVQEELEALADDLEGFVSPQPRFRDDDEDRIDSIEELFDNAIKPVSGPELRPGVRLKNFG